MNKQWFWVILPVVLILLGCWLVRPPGQREAGNVSKVAVVLPDPPVPLPSRYANATTEVPYIGSAACAGCHESHFATYSKTAHSRSMSLVDPVKQPPDGVHTHRKSGLVYTAYRRDGMLFHKQESLRGGMRHQWANHQLKYLVGSGRFARTYLVERDGLLVESPLSWYEASKQWAMSPGFEALDQPTFSRSIPKGCLQCHSGHIEQRSRKVGDLVIHEAAIGCERCHGAGDLHAKKWAGKSTASESAEEDLTIVNPRNLSRELVEDICAQCHLEGVVQVRIRGQADGDFRPGRRLRDFYTYFRTVPATKEMGVVGHVEQMHNSACYQRSETMTCVTCHDPHADVAPGAKLNYFRNKCFDCHHEDACGEPLARRESLANDNCLQCHMPQAPTEVTHVAFTHHRIGIHDEDEPVAQRQHELVEFAVAEQQSDLDRKRSHALANIEKYWSDTANRRLLPMGDKGAILLSELAATGFADAQLFLAMATLASTNGEDKPALRFAKAGLQREPSLTTELKLRLLMGDTLLSQGNFQLARGHYETLVTLRDDAADWYKLGLCEASLQDVEGAIAAIERSDQLGPADPTTLRALADLYESTGRTDRAAEARRQLHMLQAEE